MGVSHKRGTMPKGGKKGGKGDAKAADKNALKAADVWEKLSSVCRKEGKLSGWTGSNPLVDMFEDGLEEKKDDYPSQVIVSVECEPILMKVLMKAITACVEEGFDGIKSLRLWNTGVGDLGMKFLMEGLRHVPSVEKFECQGSLVTAEGCKHLAVYLRNPTVARLRLLKLDFNDIGNNL